jgi:hypothetical protein
LRTSSSVAPSTSEHDIRELLRCAERAEVIELRPQILAVSNDLREPARCDDAHIALDRQSLQRPRGARHLFIQRTTAGGERLQRVDDDEIDALKSDVVLERASIRGKQRVERGKLLLDAPRRGLEP